MAEIERVGVDEARGLLDAGYTYLDVRSEPEYAAGHPVGARNVPLMHAAAGGMRDNPDFMRAIEALFPKDARLVVGCERGGRSLRAAKLLREAGYAHVVELRPGWGGRRDPFGRVQEAGWRARGQPWETETEGGSWDELRAGI